MITHPILVLVVAMEKQIVIRLKKNYLIVLVDNLRTTEKYKTNGWNVPDDREKIDK